MFWVWPAFSSVEGKLGWLGEFGKCWVSKVYARALAVSVAADADQRSVRKLLV